MNEWLIPVAGVLALVFAFWKASWVNRQDPGNEKMIEIGKAVREGAMAFLAREYRVLAVFVVIVAVLLFVFYSRSGTQLIALSFVVGALCSGLAGFIGMRVATAANNRTTQAARQSLNAALGVAFSGGTVMGMGVVGLGVLGLSGLWIAYGGAQATGSSLSRVVQLLTGSDFQCLEADSAEKALRMLDEHDPSICILDIAMPGMSGAELAWNIRQHSPNMPLVAVSGHLDAWDPDDLTDLGFTKVYGKPFDVPEFLKGCEELSAGGAAPADAPRE